ncbi:DJ-1/PfpI family protein [Paenibacillus sp. 1_12]|uniref:DJ-1/PfpI family protein n=1 Tax=Paenibacillus sp. 1_12 TaxID=1566278 RepID=UPI000B88F049|nr:DJ-1/PfpI family protein [Paenibacillus sp. 1_12]
MKMALVIFDGMTVLDLIGWYDAVTQIKRFQPSLALSWDLCAMTDEVKDDRGLIMRSHQVRPDLSDYDLVFVPGGGATRQLKDDSDFISWLQTAEEAAYKISVCTGALLLGAAGFLSGKRATTNPSAYKLLVPYCEEVVHARIVRDGMTITAGGVAASIDLGLYVVEMLTDRDTAEQIQRSMDYPYYVSGQTDGDYVINFQSDRN